MPLINGEISLILTWSKNCAIFSAVGKTEFAITGIKLYVPVVTLSTEDIVKLLQQLESGFKRIINRNNYQSKLKDQTQNNYLDYSIDQRFQGVNKIFVLPFENKDNRNVNTIYVLPKVEIKDYNVVIDGRNFFNKPIKNDKNNL